MSEAFRISALLLLVTGWNLTTRRSKAECCFEVAIVGFACRCRTNISHIRQSRPEFGLGCQTKKIRTYPVVPSSLGSGGGLHPTYTRHPTYSLHPAPYTLHPAPHTLHPTPYKRWWNLVVWRLKAGWRFEVAIVGFACRCLGLGDQGAGVWGWGLGFRIRGLLFSDCCLVLNIEC